MHPLLGGVLLHGLQASAAACHYAPAAAAALLLLQPG
jgi:hypothetical protein